LRYKQRNISNNPKKSQQMKKFLAIAVIAASLVACGNKGDKKADENKDTTKVETPVQPIDTAKPAVIDTTKPAAPDTTKPKM
jgi:predicted small lipoprotein YifL